MDGIKVLDEIPGWIGDEAERDKEVSRDSVRRKD